jgi:flagellar hook-basal body complex protein FliE
VTPIPTITITPSGVDALDQVPGLTGGNTGASGFGTAITNALQGVVDAGHDADDKSMQAIAGGGNLTDVVTAVSKAELSLQTTMAIRDRAVQAYQDVMRMAI